MEQMKTSENGLALIRSFEGCVLNAYKCPAGVWTIGYGHTIGVKPGDKISKAYAEELLRQDVEPIERMLNSKFPWLTQNKLDALVSFIFNVGFHSFESSTLYKRIKAKASNKNICEQLLRWFYANKKPLTGLKKRRVAEANMWMGRKTYDVVFKGKDANIVELNGS